MWFRNDLRLADNPALHEARETGQPLLCVFVLEEDNGLRKLGAASRWWLHHSLAALRADLETAGARLDIVSGEAGSIIPALVEAAGAGALMFNRRYGRSAAKLDERIDTAVSGLGCEVASFNGRLLHEPWEIKTKAGGSYGVYTPFWKASLAMEDPGPPLPRHHKFEGAPYPSHGPRRVALDDLHLLPSKPNWSEGWDKTWTPGEAGAAARLRDFLKSDLADYADERNKLASRGTSRLSPHLRFGEISPRTILAEVRKAETKASTRGAEVFLAEIGWREFDYHVLHHHPDVADENLHRQFDRMPWEKLSKAELDAWKKGRTGYPVVDAGMRLVRRGPRQQYDELARGGGQRRRCRPVLPHLQSGDAGREIRPGGRLRPPLGAGTRQTERQDDPRALDAHADGARRRGHRAGEELSAADDRPQAGAPARARRLRDGEGALSDGALITLSRRAGPRTGPSGRPRGSGCRRRRARPRW